MDGGRAVTTGKAAQQSFDITAVRPRFPALRSGTAFLDGPGGTQTPATVIEAIADCLTDSNANVDGPFAASVRATALISAARVRGARFLGCDPEEVGFGLNMTSLNFHLSRAATRSLEAGDEIVVTRLDHDANIAPWLEAAADRGLTVHFANLRDDTTLDHEHLRTLINSRTRIVAFPWASNAVGTTTDVELLVSLAHEVGALAWVDATHFAVHGPIDVRALDIDVLLCSPYKFFGPHLGLFFGKAEVLERWHPYKIRPAALEPLAHRFEPGTLPNEALAGFVAAIDYIESVGWHAIIEQERLLGEQFLAGLPDPVRLYGLNEMDGRVATFALNLPGWTPQRVAAELAARDIAVWAGHYYAIEVMRHLHLDNGAVRVGFVHYNTAAEVERVLAALCEFSDESKAIRRERSTQ